MNRRIIILLSVLTLLPVLAFAGTVFESEKKTSDPYVGDRGGFNSLFVNPAGAAGQSGFELSVTAGARTKVNDIKLITAVTGMALEMSAGEFEVTSVADASVALSDLYSEGIITDDLLDAIFQGTDLDPDLFSDWDDPAAIQAIIDGGTFDDTDLTVIETNLDVVMNGNPGDPQYDDFYAGLPQEVSAEVLASVKTGFLIKGVGLGVYDQAQGIAFMDPATQEYGLETVYNELGVIAGGGFNLLQGKLAIGFSANYGVLMRNNSVISFDNIAALMDGAGSINYGYNWGLDLGAVWRPTPALGVGVVFNDVIGYSQIDTPYTADGIMGFIDADAFLMEKLEYEVTFDMDAGVSWQPDWRFVRPKLSFDMYDVVGYTRDVIDNGDSFNEAMYRTLEHMRIGANFTFFEFLKIGGQFYDHYLSVGAGLDLLFLELYGEFKVRDDIFGADDPGDIPIGGDLMVRLHF